VLHGLIDLAALAQGAAAVAGLAAAFALPAYTQGLGCGFAPSALADVAAALATAGDPARTAALAATAP
jgi:hypothetical protein